MPGGNSSSSGPQNEPHPVDRALDELKADEVIPHDQLFRMLEQLHGEVREGNIRSSKDKLQKLRDDATKELKSDVEQTEKEFQESALRDLDARLKAIEQLAEQPAPESKSFFSKEGFGEGMNKSLKKLGELAGDIGVIRDQIKESIATSIGAHIETLKPFLPAGMGDMLEKFIGNGRIQLSKALNAAKISLPMESFIFARETIDEVRRDTVADSRGWNQERVAFEFVRNLTKDPRISGKEGKAVLKGRIEVAKGAVADEINKSPKFTDAPKPPEKKFDLTINGRKVLIQESGSVDVAGKKWQLQKEGVPVLVRSASPDGADALRLDIKRQDQESIVILGDIDPLLGKLATNATDAAIPAQGKQGETLEFKRV